MPVTITRIDRERSIGGLVRRFYRIEGAGAAERRRRAEAALLRANPRLSEEGAFRRGVPVIVPEVSGLELAADLEVDTSPRQASIADLLGRVASLTERTKEVFARANEEAAAGLDNLRSDELRRVIAETAPDLEGRLPEIEEKIKARQRDVKKQGAETNRRLGEAAKLLERMARKGG